MPAKAGKRTEAAMLSDSLALDDGDGRQRDGVQRCLVALMGIDLCLHHRQAPPSLDDRRLADQPFPLAWRNEIQLVLGSHRCGYVD